MTTTAPVLAATPTCPSQVDLARRIATAAHSGQVDKSGQPYIGHPERVAARVGSDAERVVAWLHDVVEDTELTAGDLLAAGITPEEVAAVEALTHPRHEPLDDYLARVAANPLARAVKLADIADNTASHRCAVFDPATRARLASKYAYCLSVLMAD